MIVKGGIFPLTLHHIGRYERNFFIYFASSMCMSHGRKCLKWQNVLHSFFSESAAQQPNISLRDLRIKTLERRL